jgi:hypothetical protein
LLYRILPAISLVGEAGIVKMRHGAGISIRGSEQAQPAKPQMMK